MIFCNLHTPDCWCYGVCCMKWWIEGFTAEIAALGWSFSRTVGTMKVSYISSHISFQTSNQISLLIYCNLLICEIVRVCGALEWLLWSDGLATRLGQWCGGEWHARSCHWVCNALNVLGWWIFRSAQSCYTWLHCTNLYCDWPIIWAEVFFMVQVYVLIVMRRSYIRHFLVDRWAAHEQIRHRRVLQGASARGGSVLKK
jgi:hypothetical protein